MVIALATKKILIRSRKIKILGERILVRSIKTWGMNLSNLLSLLLWKMMIKSTFAKLINAKIINCMNSWTWYVIYMTIINFPYPWSKRFTAPNCLLKLKDTSFTLKTSQNCKEYSRWSRSEKETTMESYIILTSP